MEVQINGITYRQREVAPRTRRETSSMIALASIMVTALAHGGRTYKKEMPPYNLLAEMRLIQAKKSKLSRSEREYVQREFNRSFYEVLPPLQ